MACCCGSCWRMETIRRSKSSADPPQGLKRIRAATMFSSNSVPRAARTFMRGSFIAAKFSLRNGAVERTKLKLLGIIHVHLIPVQRLALGRRQDAGNRNMAEGLGVFQLDEKL